LTSGSLPVVSDMGMLYNYKYLMSERKPAKTLTLTGLSDEFRASDFVFSGLFGLGGCHA
jgi:hypothetical protein